MKTKTEKTKKRGGWSEQKGVSDRGPTENRTDVGHTEERKKKKENKRKEKKPNNKIPPTETR